ncbi:uncharacterized protein LOC143281211 [Babylonia areolata]|uniref:uncharacterized protein LOC143281211 n=1 Tax=Babylonia areolata TaxID=304850 RepID=UPI003FCF16B0
MEVTVKLVIGLVVAALLGLLFIVSCFFSVVKAFRDRREMKARLAAKRAACLNGHAPGQQEAACPEGEEGGGRRGRPNILIVHDGEREKRVKRGSGWSNMASSPRPLPSALSSPEEVNSGHTESTTVAEVACHPGSLTTSPGDDDDDDDSEGAEGGLEAVVNGRCSMPGRVGDPEGVEGRGETGVDIQGSVITYRRSSLTPCDPGGIVTTFPSRSSRDGETGKQVGRSGKERDETRKQVEHSGRSGSVEGRPESTGPSYSDTSRYNMNFVAEADVISGGGRRTERRQSPPVHQFAKHRKVSPRHAAYGAELACARYNPRRNSYAAAIASDPDWLDRAAVRRHSDEVRPRSASTSRLARDELRMRSQCRDGADNPAYNAADDKIVI